MQELPLLGGFNIDLINKNKVYDQKSEA